MFHNFDECNGFLTRSKWPQNLSNEEAVRLACRKGYLDMCRTLRGFSKTPNKEAILNRANDIVIKYLDALLSTAKIEKSSFDSCLTQKNFNALSKSFGSFNCTIGQAQKWFNMSAKYLYCYLIVKDLDIPKAFEFCHIPIDNIVLYNAHKRYGVNINLRPWSKLEDINLYLNFQRKINEIGQQNSRTPLQMDFILWH